MTISFFAHRYRRQPYRFSLALKCTPRSSRRHLDKRLELLLAAEMGDFHNTFLHGKDQCAIATADGMALDCPRQDTMQDHVDAADFSLMSSSMVTTLLNAASSPVTPGASSPPLDQTKNTSFTPPARPSSTPFPHLERRSSVHASIESEIGWAGRLYHLNNEQSYQNFPTNEYTMPRMTHFEELPTEVHEAILDHIFGYCVSPTSRSAMRISSLTIGWGTALRHSRRRELTALALVNRTWSILVQQRLYRHLKLKATKDSIEDAAFHLARQPHLASYVKHVETWFPVFQPTYGPLASTNTLALPTVTTDGLTNATYTLPRNNCTLAEVFQFVSEVVPEARVLTLEGGERRKAPKVLQFHGGSPESIQALHPITSVRTLVTKGQWNLIRDNRDFALIMSALPNLEEWQGSYSKPKSKSYITAADFLPTLPTHVKNVSLCMENDYRREAVMPAFYYKVSLKAHMCVNMAQVLPSLEHFAYTGRVCHHLFDVARRLADPMTSRLRSVDITVKNCCRKAYSFHESGSGIQDLVFIETFEKLVLSAIRSLEKFKRLEYLRIRFVDLGLRAEIQTNTTSANLFLDSVLPPLNPYFLMQQGQCSGVWSDQIIAEMARVRPFASFSDLSDTFGSIIYSKEGRMVIAPEHPRTRITSLKLSNYRSLASRITIQ